jgi:peptidoglycan/LPS O-acetylase OafA/YrhL
VPPTSERHQSRRHSGHHHRSRRRRAARGFRPDIESLRAVAVLLVIANHVYGKPVGGFVGVDVFFVISGFLITGLLLKQQQSAGRVSFRDFYARRIRRILPMALLVLLATNVAAYFVFVGERFAQTRQDSIWALAFAANIHFAHIGTNYFDQRRPPSTVQHYWSLSVEEQFYVVWPLLIFLVGLAATRIRRSARAALGPVALAAVVGSLAYCVIKTASSPTAAYFATPARAWELGVGALLAIYWERVETIPAAVRAALGWIGITGLAVSVLTISATSSFPGWRATLPVLSTGALIVSGMSRNGPGERRVLDNPPLRYVGRLSYSLYLWHWPCLVLGSSIWGSTSLQVRLGVPVVAMALSVFSFYLVENPIRESTWLSPRTHHKRSRRKPVRYWNRPEVRKAGGALGATTVVVIIAAVVFHSSAVPAVQVQTHNVGFHTAVSHEKGTTTVSTPDQQVANAVSNALRVSRWSTLNPPLSHLDDAIAPEWLTDGCNLVTQSNLSKCVFGPANARHEAVVIGDSMALSWSPTIIGVLAAKNWKVQLLTYNECPAVAEHTAQSPTTRTTSFALCDAHRKFVMAQIKKIRPDAVIMSSDSQHFIGLQVGVTALPGPAWRAGVERLLADLMPFTHHEVILSQPPGSGNLQDCVTRFSHPSDCDADVSPQWLETSGLEQSAATSQHAAYINAVSWFCADNKCPAVVGDTPVFADGAHLTARYATQLTPVLRGPLLQAVGAA